MCTDMKTQLFFCEFKNYIALAFEIDQSKLDNLFDIYELYLDSNSSIFHFVNSNFNAISERVNSI